MNKTLYSEQQKVFLEALRSAREQAKLTQTEVALRLNVQQSDISKCERGVRRLDVVELRAWIQALGQGFPEFVTNLEQKLAAGDLLRSGGRSRHLSDSPG
jgi:transcriptional regulator with XRE-family HTH domain